MNRFEIVITATLLLLLCQACGNRRPDNILDEARFTDLVTDIFQLQGMQRFGYLNDSVRMEDYYQELFAKHHTDRAQLDSTVAWYLIHPEAYYRICDTIEIRLNRRVDSLHQAEKEPPVNVRDGETRP